MLFNSVFFITCFLPVAFGGFLLTARLAGSMASRLWLLLVNMFFYAWWNPVFMLLLTGSILLNFKLGSLIRITAPGRKWLMNGLAFNLGLLIFFKYTNFLASLAGITLPHGGIALPLGISFFTFQQVMFLVDTYRREADVTGIVDYACFVSFFPHLIAGPIVRPNAIIPQFTGLRPLRDWPKRFSEGAEIFLLGLAKKLVLADSFARFSDPGFAAAALHRPISLVEAWVALLAYGLQIYFDFSGYSDMAIGLARMFGIHFPANFNSPYRATNVSEFWKRWNMTLSAFLRDYLYIPLGGNRHGERRRIFNLMVTMLLGGLWHGAALKFALWGGLHGVFLVVHGWFKRTGISLPRIASQALTILLVLLAWVPFRAESFSASVAFYKGLFGLNGALLPDILMSRLPFLSHVAQTVPVLPYLGDARTMSLPQGLLLLLAGWIIVLVMPTTQSLGRVGRGAALVGSFGFVLQTLFFAPFTVPFIYFRF